MAADNFDMYKALHGNHWGAPALIPALRNIPAEHRQKAIATALQEIAEDERRSALKAKFNVLSTDQIERLPGEEGGS
jgi:hypothetical protein